MIIWTILATAAAVSVTGLWIAYRRQVKKIERKLTFLEEHRTNMSLTSDLPFSELNGLIDSINKIVQNTRQMQQAAKQSEDSLKETITNLSHDIRTPLTSLDGYFQLLSQTESEEEREHYIRVIQSRITGLKDMLEELFTYTKLQNEKYQLESEETDFGQSVYDTIFSFYDAFKEKAIEPEIDFYEGRLYIEASREALRRALQNVVKNAMEHGEKRITLRLWEDGGCAVFSCSNDVSDESKTDMEHIFDRFYKGDTARSTASTGLGLSITKGLTEKMNGTVTAQLAASVFTVEIRFPLIRRLSDDEKTGASDS